MKMGKEGLIFLVGVTATSIIIGSLFLLPLYSKNKEFKMKIDRINKVNDDLFKENNELIKKNDIIIKESNEKDNKIKEMEYKIKNLEFKSVNFNQNDITQLTRIKRKQLELLFKSNSTYENLIGLEQAFIDAESTYNINAMFLLGIVSQESGFVSSRRALEDNNLTGYAIYHNGSERAFNSQYESIMSTAKLLKSEYIENRKIKDMRSINEVYCPADNYKWSNSILSIVNDYMSELEVINSQFNDELMSI